MSSIASGLVLGFFLATAYGSGFHLFLGGPARKIVLFVTAAWIGFAIGHFVGDLLDLEIFKLGTVHLFTASVGAWIALIVAWLLSKRET